MTFHWATPQHADGDVSLALKADSTQTFTVIHSGGEIDRDLALELVESVAAWTATAEPGTTRRVDLWAPAWHRRVVSLMATATAFGAPTCDMHLFAADDLGERMKARGVIVRLRKARQSVLDDAEFRAICQGLRVRYI
jgi:hypothetical protein